MQFANSSLAYGFLAPVVHSLNYFISSATGPSDAGSSDIICPFLFLRVHLKKPRSIVVQNIPFLFLC